MTIIKRNVTKEIKLLARERVGKVKAGKVIKNKKDKFTQQEGCIKNLGKILYPNEDWDN